MIPSRSVPVLRLARWSAPLAAAALLAGPIGPLAAQEAVDAPASGGAGGAATPPEARAPGASPELQAAEAAVREWLALTDAGDFDEAWKTAAGALQVATTPQTLKAAINDGRRPYEPLGERALTGARRIDNPPGAAPGEYVFLRFQRTAVGGGTVRETVVPKREGGVWRVAAYFISRE